MAFVIADRVRETTLTSGTGTLTLAGPYSGFQAFSVIGNGNTTYYAVIDPTTGAWEVGIGTYTSSGNTLSRDTVLSSSNSGGLVSFGSGVKDAICTQPSERNVYVVGSDVVAENSAKVPNTLLANSSVTIGSTSVSLGATAATLAGLTSVTAAQFNGSAAGLTGLKTINGNSIIGSGNIQIDGGVVSFNTRTGAVTLTSEDVTTALEDASVTFAKLQNIDTGRILGRSTAGNGDVEALTALPAGVTAPASSIAGALNASGAAPLFACRAWVNFNGTGTVAIRASGNVSSITDGGTGTFTINFTTAMPDAAYAAVGTAVNSNNFFTGITSSIPTQLSGCEIRVTTDAGSLNDPNFCSYAFFR